MRGRGSPRALVLSFAALVASSCPAFAEAAPADLKEASSRLAAAASPAEYAALLDSFSTSLPPSDALALLDQGIAQAGQAYRRALLIKAADLDLLVGLFGDAASRYEAAASSPAASSPTAGGRDWGLLLRAARCDIAAGEAEKASALSADVILASGDPDLAAAARLVGAWALVMQGRPADAAALASAIAGAPKGASPSAERRREARFLLWLCADAGGKAAAAATLASEFPGSPEALIAAGSASAPPLPHWYLGGLGAAQAAKPPLGAAPAPTPMAPASAAAPTPVAPASAAAPAASAPAASPASAAAPPPSAAPTARGKRLQVGYFSREDNAQALRDELASKGFAALVEPRLRAQGSGAPAEKRWIVVVEGGKDRARTAQALKDAGYESYVID
jgi:cell division septation protein DedD